VVYGAGGIEAPPMGAQQVGGLCVAIDHFNGLPMYERSAVA
jgi:hypothetical protein